jgi:hypothetical protein
MTRGRLWWRRSCLWLRKRVRITIRAVKAEVPMKVKVFAVSAGYLSSFSGTGAKLERDINAWLEQHSNVRVVEIRQSSSGGSLEPSKIVVSVWYEDAAEPGSAPDPARTTAFRGS